MAIFSDKNEVTVVQNLCGDDAQAFVNAIDKVTSHVLSSWKKRPLIQIQTFHSTE